MKINRKCLYEILVMRLLKSISKTKTVQSNLRFLSLPAFGSSVTFFSIEVPDLTYSDSY